MNDKPDTKDRILLAAKKLMAEKGFDGTSVREIADAANSNVSAINYHFKSKLGLYWALLEESFQWIEAGIKNSCSVAENFDQLIMEVYHFLTREPEHVRSTMKSLLTNVGESPSSIEDHARAISTTPGMPGYKYLASFVQDQLDQGVAEESIYWTVNTVFSCVFHMALMSTTVKFEVMNQAAGISKTDICQQHLLHLGKAALLYANSNNKELAQQIVMPQFSKSITEPT